MNDVGIDGGEYLFSGVKAIDGSLLRNISVGGTLNLRYAPLPYAKGKQYSNQWRGWGYVNLIYSPVSSEL